MCLMKKAPAIILAPQKPQDPVERHQADASVTKNSVNDNQVSGYLQNIKTTPVGLEDNAQTKKKTLLGE